MRIIPVKKSWWLLFIIACVSCTKQITTSPFLSTQVKKIIASKDSTTKPVDSSALPSAGTYITYTILQGQQYCVGNIYPPYTTSAMHFDVKFDSSDIYTNVIPTNQYDYNKLYGFSDNMSDHHSFSARFGWRWCHNEIELSAYTYNDGVRSILDLGGVDLNKEHKCTILVNGSHYDFVLDGDTTSVARTSKTTQAIGYKLLPYFGGDEVAPHTMTIRIKETN